MFIIQCGKPELPPPYYSKGAGPVPHLVCVFNQLQINLTISAMNNSV